jgi:beta-galactosidase GanA
MISLILARTIKPEVSRSVNASTAKRIVLLGLFLALFSTCNRARAQQVQAPAQTQSQAKTTHANDRPLPRIVQESGRYALLVDGSPYLILGAQVNNSSAWPAMLPKVWPAIEYLHANTVEMPVYWEQFEPQQGRFDYTVVDTLLAQARDHHIHLVLLWFGTWKNGSAHYIPEWMKRSPERYPRITGANGRKLDSPSPYAVEALQADVHAFTALMRHLKMADHQRTAIMVQVENQPGTWGSVRDYSPTAQKVFEAPVPHELLAALHKDGGAPSANWQAVFGEDAEELFHAWSVARYIEQVAAAGKAVYPLPLYVNAALRNPVHPGRPPSYESGGPTDNVIPIWKAAAPSIDLLAPDIYMDDNAQYLKVLELYHRRDNALFVPESRNDPAYSRYFFAALGQQAIGFSPFGLDYTGYSNSPLGAAKITEDSLAPFALNYKLIGPMDREIALLNFGGKLQAVAEEKGQPSQSLDFGPWTATVSYGLRQFGPGENPPGNPEPIGRALVAKLADDQFLVAGFFCRVDFHMSDAAAGKQRQFLRVEEGTYENGTFRPIRIWNGDQTDWGLNFTSVPQALRVSLATY